MKTTRPILLTLLMAGMMAGGLTSCAPVQSITGGGEPSFSVLGRDGSSLLPPDYSMLQMGRAISEGEVDIYDPWLSAFMVAPPGHVQDPLDMFPAHGGLFVRDKHVKVFTLASDGVDDNSYTSFLTTLDGAGDFGGLAAPPVPLVDIETLLP